MSETATRTVEVYIGFPNFVWATDYVRIPRDTPADRIEAAAVAAITAELDEQGTETAFVGVYNVPEIEEDGDGPDDDD